MPYVVKNISDSNCCFCLDLGFATRGWACVESSAHDIDREQLGWSAGRLIDIQSCIVGGFFYALTGVLDVTLYNAVLSACDLDAICGCFFLTVTSSSDFTERWESCWVAKSLVFADGNGAPRFAGLRLKLFNRSGFKQIRWHQTCVHLFWKYYRIHWNRSFLMFPQALDEESAASQLDNIVRMKLQKLPLWKYVGVVLFFVQLSRQMWSATTAALVLVKKQGTGKKHFAFLLTSWSSAWILVASGWKVKAGRWLLWSKFDPKRLTNVKHEIMKIFLCPTHRFHVVRHEFDGMVMNMNEVLSWLHDWRRTHPITRPCFTKVINLHTVPNLTSRFVWGKSLRSPSIQLWVHAKKTMSILQCRNSFWWCINTKWNQTGHQSMCFRWCFSAFFPHILMCFLFFLPACRSIQQLKCATWERVQIHNKTY